MLERVDWKAAIWASLIAGVVFMTMEMVLVATVGGGSAWAPPRMIAAMAMGKSVLPPPATFEPVMMAVAMTIHMLLSLVLGMILAVLLAAIRAGVVLAAVVGTGFGLAVYYFDFYLMAEYFPWFAMARNAISIISHAVFGLVLGAGYALLRRDIVRRSAGPDSV